MMKIVLNGAERELAGPVTVAQLLHVSGFGAKRVAVELNGEVVPRSLHVERDVADGDRIEIVHAIGGG